MKYNKLLASLFFTGMLLLSGCGSSDSSSSTKTAAPAAEVPAEVKTVLSSTTITTTNGEVIRVDQTANGFIFEGHENQIVLLEVYGHDCPHCIDSIPGYNSLQNKYPNDVYVVTIQSYDTMNNAGLQQYVNTHGIQYDTVSKENSGAMLPYIQNLTGYNLEGVPYLMVFSRDGDLAEALPPQDLPITYVDGLIQGLL